MLATVVQETASTSPRRSARAGNPPAGAFVVNAHRGGGVITLPADGYELVGPADAPVIVVLGGISAHRHAFAHDDNTAAGWWQAFIGSAKAIDTRCYRVLSCDYAWRADGPVETRDQAALIAAILDRLQISAVEAIVGSSYGGMVGLAFAALYPNRVSRLVCISAAHEAHPMATAIRVVQRRIIRLARDAGRPRDGVALARALGVTTYRTADEFAERFGGPVDETETGLRFPVEEYLDHQGDRFAATFEGDRYLALSESLDLHRVDPKLITAAVTLVAVDRDTLVPPWQMRELFAWLSGPGRFVELSSCFGHDAFLKEEEAIADILTRTLGGRHVI